MSIIAGHADFDDVTIENSLLTEAKDKVLGNGQSRRFTWLFEDFYQSPAAYFNNTGWCVTGGSTDNPIAGDEAGGSIICTTTATSGHAAGLVPANAIVGPPATKPFFMCARFAITTAIDAAAKCQVGLIDGSNSLSLGVTGSLTTANFVLQHGAGFAGSSVSLGVPIDTAYHVWRMWSNGQDGKVYAQIDDNAPVSVTPSVTLTKGNFFLYAQNGATSADRRVKIDYLGIAAGR